MADFSVLLPDGITENGAAGAKAVVFAGDAPIIGSELNEAQYLGLLRQYKTNKVLGCGFIVEGAVNTAYATWSIANLIVVMESDENFGTGNILTTGPLEYTMQALTEGQTLWLHVPTNEIQYTPTEHDEDIYEFGNAETTAIAKVDGHNYMWDARYNAESSRRIFTNFHLATTNNETEGLSSLPIATVTDGVLVFSDYKMKTHKEVADDVATHLAASNPHGSPLTGRPYNLFIAANDATAAEKVGADYLCDGTDDHLLIQTALAALPATGGVIQLSSGTFNISDTITISNDNVVLQGFGLNQTALVADIIADLSQPLVSILGVVGTPIQSTVLKDLLISNHGTYVFEQCVHVNLAYEAQLHSCYIFGTGGYGVLIEDSTGVFIENSIISNVYGIHATDSENIGIKNNRWIYGSSVAVYIIGSTNTVRESILIDGNIIEGEVLIQSLAGTSSKWDKVQILNNRIYADGNTAIYIRSAYTGSVASQSVISGNVCNNTGVYPCCELLKGIGITITGNSFNSATDLAFKATNGGQISFCNNILTATTAKQPIITDCTSILVLGNICTPATNWTFTNSTVRPDSSLYTYNFSGSN